MPWQLLKKDILGKVKAYVYVVEFQKRGLPHAHFLLIMQGKYKLTCLEQYDSLISTELPDKHKYLELYTVVVKHMIQGPCGMLNCKCPFMKDISSCKNHYPWPFNSAILQGKDFYPVYRHREDCRIARVRKHNLNYRWVIHYNPYFCDCSIATSTLRSAQA